MAQSQETLRSGEVRISNTGIIRVGGFHAVLEGTNGKILQTIYSDLLGYKTCTVAVKDINTGIYYTKLNNDGDKILNDMFREDWGLDDIFENIALAYDNKRYYDGNQFIGVMSDGKELILCIGNGPNINEYQSHFYTCFINNSF